MDRARSLNELDRTVLHIAPVLPRDERAIAEALCRSRLLWKTFTYTVAGGTWLSSIPYVRRRLALIRPALTLDPESLRSLSLRDFLLKAIIICGVGPVRAVDCADALLDRLGARGLSRQMSVVIGREGACSHSFKRAREMGIFTIYHLPIAHYATVSKLLAEEASIFGHICQVSFDSAITEPTRLQRKDNELRWADWVLCPSKFVAESVVREGFQRDRIKVIPYAGCHLDATQDTDQIQRREPVFICAGNLTVRKGVHRLLRVWKALGAYRTHKLRLIGKMYLKQKFLNEFRGVYEYCPRLNQAELLSEFSRAQALVLNSAAEGFAMVILEAMSCATPVLVSRNSGAEGFIEDGCEGRLFDFANDNQLASVLNWALGHPDELLMMGRNARERVRQWQWCNFQEEFTCWMRSIMGSSENLRKGTP